MNKNHVFCLFGFIVFKYLMRYRDCVWKLYTNDLLFYKKNFFMKIMTEN